MLVDGPHILLKQLCHVFLSQLNRFAFEVDIYARYRLRFDMERSRSGSARWSDPDPPIPTARASCHSSMS